MKKRYCVRLKIKIKIMTKIKYLLVLVLMISIGCEKSDFLKERPTDRFVVGNFYRGQAEAEAAVTAIYSTLYDIYDRNMIILGDLPTDDERNGIGMPNPNLVDLEYLRHTSQNTFVANMWRFNYSGISRANTAIDNIEKMDLGDNIKKQLLAEAHFLRGLFYFNLVQFFGEVPIILHLESLQDAFLPRSSKDDVYTQVVNDLVAAETDLPISYDDKEIGRVTKGAAKILLGKVYLTNHHYDLAVDKLSEVVDHEGDYGYGLHQSFKDNWNLGTQNGKEMVFAIQYSISPGHTNIKMTAEGAKYSMPGGHILPGIQGDIWEADIPTFDLFSIYEDDDARKWVTFRLHYTSPTDGLTYTSSIPMFGKYWQDGITTPGSQCTINTFVLRYSDALLSYAEALNEVGRTGDAEKLINRVRERAYGDNGHDFNGLSQNVFREKVYLERRLELAGEGKRFFDLVRTGRFVDVMKAHGPREASLSGQSIKNDISAGAVEFRSLFPIPQSDIDATNHLITQNEGY